MIKEAAKFFLLSLLCGSAFCGQEIKVPLTVVDDIASPGTTYLSVQSGGVTIDPDLTLSNLTATRLLASDGSKLVVSVADLASWIAGTSSEITITNDGDGTVTISLPDAVIIGTLDTGQGANELYDMDQDVMSSSSPTFNVLSLTTDLSIANGGTGASSLDDVVGTANEITVTAGADTVIGGDVTISLPDDVTIGTLDTGQGGNELYDMDQNVKTTNSPTFAGLTLTADLTVANGGTGASSLDDIAGTTNEIEVTAGADTVIGGDVTIGLPDAVTVVTMNTGQGANELYDMNQNVQTGDGVTFATVNTGEGANELYDMDQNVLTSSDVTVGSLEVDGNVTLGDATADVTTVSGELDGSRHSWVISESATETNTMYANSYLVVGGITQSSTVGMRAATSGSIVGISINCNVTAANASGSLWVEVNGSGLYGVALPSGTGVGNVGVRQNRGVDTFAAGNIISFRVYNGTFTTYTFNNYTIELEYYYDD